MANRLPITILNSFDRVQTLVLEPITQVFELTQGASVTPIYAVDSGDRVDVTIARDEGGALVVHADHPVRRPLYS